ncbi:MAG: hypothetical protein AAF491_12240, partial [Verrucomicrobiota bacterium]
TFRWNSTTFSLRMNNPETTPPSPEGAIPSMVPIDSLTKRDYFAVHLFEAVTSKLSLNCSLQDKAQHAVDAADALLEALKREA